MMSDKERQVKMISDKEQLINKIFCSDAFTILQSFPEQFIDCIVVTVHK